MEIEHSSKFILRVIKFGKWKKSNGDLRLVLGFFYTVYALKQRDIAWCAVGEVENTRLLSSSA